MPTYKEMMQTKKLFDDFFGDEMTAIDNKQIILKEMDIAVERAKLAANDLIVTLKFIREKYAELRKEYDEI